MLRGVDGADSRDGGIGTATATTCETRVSIPQPPRRPPRRLAILPWAAAASPWVQPFAVGTVCDRFPPGAPGSYRGGMATATMSMNKIIHGAVRRDLDRFRRALDSFPDGDQDRAAALHRAWANFDAQLTDHHEGEHEIVWPALEAIGIGGPTLETFDEEHEAMAAALANARTAMQQLRDSASRADALAAVAEVERLQRTTVSHLDHEEQVTEPALSEHEGHPALKEMGRKFSRRSGPAKAGAYFAWLQDGATAEEKAALRAHVPGPVLLVLSGLLGRGYRRHVAPVWHS